MFFCFFLSTHVVAQSATREYVFSKIFACRYSAAVRWETEKPTATIHAALWPRVCNYQNLLKEPEVLKEIEVNRQQKRSLKKFVMKVEGIARSWVHPRRFDEQKFYVTKEDSESELATILVDRQLRRLENIKNRMNLRAIGGYSGLAFASQGIGILLSAKEKEDLENTVAKVRDEFRSKYQVRMKKTISKIYQPLKSSQTERIRKVFPGDVLPDIFIAQLRYAITLDKEIGMSSPQRFRQLVSSRPRFQSIGDGRFTVKPFEKKTFILSLVTDGMTQERSRELTLSDLQWEELLKIRKNCSKQMDRCYETWNQSEGTKADLAKMEHGYQDAHEAKEKAITELLNSVQRNQAKRFFIKRELQKFGQIADLLVGDLGRELEISDQQRNQVRRAIKMELNEWKKLALKWESELEDRMNKVLSAQTRKLLKKKLGPKISYLTPGLSQFTKDTRR